MNQIAFNDAAAEFLEWAEFEYNRHPNSYKRIRTSLTSLAAYFREVPVASITAGDVEKFKVWRRKNPRQHARTRKDQTGPRPLARGLMVSDVTLRHDLHALSTLFQYGERRRWNDHNPVRQVEIPSDADAMRVRVVTPEEERSYLAIAQKHPDLCDLVRLMLRQGLRPDEALHLEKRNYDPVANTILIARGKSKAARRVLRLVPDSETIVKARRGTPGPWLFPSPRDSSRALTKLNNRHNEVRKEAGLEDVVLYHFRHTFATRMAQAGMPLTTLAAILGHSNLRCVLRYVHPDQADMNQAMLRFSTPSPAPAAPANAPEILEYLVELFAKRESLGSGLVR